MTEVKAKTKKPIYKQWWLWALVAVVVVAGAAGSGQGKDDESRSETPAVVEEVQQDAGGEEGQLASTGLEEAPASESAPEPEPEIDVPSEYRSALRKAESYSSVMHMSKQGIYDQLVSEYGEGFSEEAAQYAIDNLEADWNANALAKAEQYQDQMAMSPNAIHDQLTSEYGEQFTEEEADYAIANLS